MTPKMKIEVSGPDGHREQRITDIPLAHKKDTLADIARILFLLVFVGATVTLSPADKDTKEENKQ